MVMSTVEIFIRAGLRMLVIWGSCAAVGIPLMKIIIDIAYESWRGEDV